MLHAIARLDSDRHTPLRTRVNIDISLPVILETIASAASLYSCPDTVAAISAVLYLGFALSLRPDDYMRPTANNHHRLRGCQFAFWFTDISTPIFLHETSTYPPLGTRPLRLSLLPDKDKAHQTNNMIMRACAANPDHSKPCFILYLLNFFRLFPCPGPYNAVFAGVPPSIRLYALVNSTLKYTARRLGLNPAQLLPRGLRAGASTHIGAAGGTQHDQKLSGGWRSDAYTIYQRPNFAASDRCAAAMHNPDCINLNILRYTHSTPGLLPIPL